MVCIYIVMQASVSDLGPNSLFFTFFQRAHRAYVIDPLSFLTSDDLNYTRHTMEEKSQHHKIRVHHPHLTVRIPPLCCQYRTTGSLGISRPVSAELSPLSQLSLCAW